MFADLRYTLRTMTKNLRFTLLAVFVMTTGISLALYMQSFLHNTLTAPLPFEGGERIRILTPITNTNPWLAFRLSDYEDMKRAQTSFEIFDTYYNRRRNLLTTDRSFRERVFYVNPPFFEISEALPLMGRVFDQNDMREGAEPVVIIGESVWNALYGRDSDVLGKSIRIENVPHKIVGVMPKSYRFPDYGKIWAPFDLTTQGLERRDVSFATVYGRLAPGVSDKQAEADIVGIAQEIAERFPELNKGKSAYMTTFQERTAMTSDMLILALKLCVVLVLLLACINTGNLLLARALERNKETAIRLALGAPRSRLVKQMLLESFFICILSGLLSLLIVGASLKLSLGALSKMFLASEPPYWWQYALSLESYLTCIFVVIITAILTGFLPAWRATGGDINRVLRDGTRGAQGMVSSVLSKAIVITEVGLSVALLLVASSVAYSVYKKNNTDYGVQLDGYLTAEVSLPPAEYDTDNKRLNYFKRIERELEKEAGVEDVSFTQMVPITWSMLQEFAIEGVDYGKEPSYPNPEKLIVSNDYLASMGVKLYEGRHFRPQDNSSAPAVALVTRKFVDKYLKGENPIGKRLRQVGDEERWYTIVGVVNDVVHGWPYAYNIVKSSVFVSMEQNTSLSMSIVIRTSGDPNLLRQPLENLAYKIEPNAPLFNVLTMRRNHERAVADINFISRLFTAFALASLVLAFSGIYGVMAYITTQKTQEIGVRRALGANDSNLYRHFVKQSLKQLAMGLLIGVPIGVSLINMLADSELSSYSVLLFIGIPLAITATVVFATVNPVRKVLAQEPVVALRYE